MNEAGTQIFLLWSQTGLVLFEIYSYLELSDNATACCYIFFMSYLFNIDVVSDY